MPVKKGILKNSGPLTLPLSADRKSATASSVADFLSADIRYSKCIAPNNYGEMFDCVCYVLIARICTKAKFCRLPRFDGQKKM